ncbi:hypothetical protein EVAR_20448_1 [Eumeta japonica]|uniref:DUF1659 domain-containing protein n=1 Tax=Eumeta variegata TaxID=151549 RepID=A0A4C1TZ85_EUMVA|nr:hypothetical protein EVAR_20448_1 [Eumeta japonica]
MMQTKVTATGSLSDIVLQVAYASDTNNVHQPSKNSTLRGVDLEIFTLAQSESKAIADRVLEDSLNTLQGIELVST